MLDLPRGIRNRNPGNLRAASTYVWRGQVDVDGDGFVIFSSMDWGIRAMTRVLLNYEEHYGLRTVRSAITRWAPPSENDTEGYIDFVAQWLKVDPDEPVDWHARAVDMITAIITRENGPGLVGSYTIKAGIALSHER